MKRNLIAASMGLSMLLALCGCGNTGGVDNTVSPSPSSSTAVDNNGGDLPNNAGGTANNDTGISDAPGGAVTDGTTGTNGSVDNNGTADNAKYGSYRAGRNGSVDGSNNSVRSAIRDAGDSLRGAVRNVTGG